jgi:hypothetical protein
MASLFPFPEIRSGQKKLINGINKDNFKMVQLLAEGYKASRDEAEQLNKEFNEIDLEHWGEY